MGTNPLVPQGQLNKIQASASVIDLPDLNVSASFLAAEGISLAFEGEASGYIGTMTGAVPSPNPYQMATAMLHILKTNGIAELWKEQQEDSTSIGDVSIVGDSTTLSDYYLTNCTIKGVGDLPFNGTTPAFVVTIVGTYIINSSLFN